MTGICSRVNWDGLVDKMGVIEKEDLVCVGSFSGLSIGWLVGLGGFTIAVIASGYLGFKAQKFTKIKQQCLELAILNGTLPDPNYLAQLDVQIARYTKLSYINIVNLLVSPILLGLGVGAVCGCGVCGVCSTRNCCYDHLTNEHE